LKTIREHTEKQYPTSSIMKKLDSALENDVNTVQGLRIFMYAANSNKGVIDIKNVVETFGL
jgi:hypothetical protein